MIFDRVNKKPYISLSYYFFALTSKLKIIIIGLRLLISYNTALVDMFDIFCADV